MRLAEGLIRQYRQRPDARSVIDRAVEILVRVASMDQVSNVTRAMAFSLLGSALRERFEVNQEPEDLDAAVVAYERSVAALPPDSLMMTGVLLDRAETLHAKYELTLDREDLERAIEAMDQGLEVAGQDIPDRPDLVVVQAHHLHDYHDQESSLPSLERAIDLLRDEAGPKSGHLDGEAIAGTLALVLAARARATWGPKDLAEAVEHCEESLASCTHQSVRELLFAELGSLLFSSFYVTGELVYLGRSREVLEQALEDVKGASQAWTGVIVSRLASVLIATHAMTGDAEVIESVLELLEATAGDSELDPTTKINLEMQRGQALRERSHHPPGIVDLETAIAMFEELAQDVIPSDNQRIAIWSMLSEALRERFQLTSETLSINRAVFAALQAAQIATADSLLRVQAQNAAGQAFAQRAASAFGTLADWTEAERAFREAVAEAPTDSHASLFAAVSLGQALLDKSRSRGEPADFDEAVWWFKKSRAANESIWRTLGLVSLAHALHERYRRKGQAGDLEEAIDLLASLGSDPRAGTDPSEVFELLGDLYDSRSLPTGETSDRQRAIACWEQALARAAASTRLPMTYRLSMRAKRVGLHGKLVDAYLADDAAAGGDERARRAIEVAESGKAQVLTDIIGRIDLPIPRSLAGPQAERERALTTELNGIDLADMHALDVSESAGPSTDDAGSEVGPPAVMHLSDQAVTTARRDRLLRRERLHSDLEQLWSEMEDRGADAGDYVALRRGYAVDWPTLIGSARSLGHDTALVSLTITAERTLCQIVHADSLAPDSVCAAIGLDRWQDVLRRVRKELHTSREEHGRSETWNEPLHPLLRQMADALKGAKTIILAPAGDAHFVPWELLLSSLPRRSQEGSPAVVLVPGLGVLSRLLARPAKTARRILVVGNPTGDLPNAQHEAIRIAGRFGVPPLIRQDATRDSVLAALHDADIAHFASHGYFHQSSALDSGIVLADGVVTARDILQRRTRASLIVLSGCETGLAGALTGEEFSGLVQSFLQAGAAAMVVSLWQVEDRATASIMASFYTALQAGVSKPHALRQAVREYKNRSAPDDPHRWAGFTTVGDPRPMTFTMHS